MTTILNDLMWLLVLSATVRLVSGLWPGSAGETVGGLLMAGFVFGYLPWKYWWRK